VVAEGEKLNSIYPGKKLGSASLILPVPSPGFLVPKKRSKEIEDVPYVQESGRNCAIICRIYGKFKLKSRIIPHRSKQCI
jgi:hypothetical protein